MLQKKEIGNRIKDLRNKNKYSQSYVADMLFISQAAYSLIENAQNGVVADHIIGLSNLYQVTTDYILKGDDMLMNISPSQGFIPYYKVKAHAGNVNNFSGSLDQIEIEWYRIPGYNSSGENNLFEVEGSSMVPTILHGDILICQIQRDFSKILDGSVVLIVTKDSLLVKRLRMSEEPNYFLFENDNPEEGEVLKLNKNDIKEIHIVRGKITNFPTHSPSLNIDVLKFRNLEESVKHLQKELFRINKELKT